MFWRLSATVRGKLQYSIELIRILFSLRLLLLRMDVSIATKPIAPWACGIALLLSPISRGQPYSSTPIGNRYSIFLSRQSS